MTDPGGMRVGNREREATVAVLRGASDEGRLTPAELAQRIDTTRAARTFADLDDVVSDLPVARPSTELLRPAGLHVYDPSLVGMDPDHRRELSGGMSSRLERGVWLVPPYLSVGAGWGSVRLDFLQAICPHSVVDIAVSKRIGSTIFVLPHGWGANLDQVRRGMGNVSSRVNSVAEAGRPLLILHGRFGAGSTDIRHANWLDRRRVRRDQRSAVTPTGGPPSGLLDGGFPGAAPQDAPPQDAPR